jgi:hypothetical protein
LEQVWVRGGRFPEISERYITKCFYLLENKEEEELQDTWLKLESFIIELDV